MGVIYLLSLSLFAAGWFVGTRLQKENANTLREGDTSAIKGARHRGGKY